MANLYALKEDLDMVADDVQNLKKSYNLLDYIAKVVRDCEIEQLAQSAQMRRIESRLTVIEADLLDVKTRLTSVEAKLTNIETNIELIMKHLKIKNH